MAAPLGRKEAVPSRTEGIPSWAEGNPGQSEGNPGQSEGNPNRAEGNPSRAEGIPNVCPSVKSKPFNGLRPTPAGGLGVTPEIRRLRRLSRSQVSRGRWRSRRLPWKPSPPLPSGRVVPRPPRSASAMQSSVRPALAEGVNRRRFCATRLSCSISALSIRAMRTPIAEKQKVTWGAYSVSCW